MTFTTQNRSTYFWLEGDLVMFPAVVANYFEPLTSVVAFGSLLRTALGTPLWRHHVPLIKDLLFFFGEKEGLFALNARCFDVRHNFSP